MKESSFNPAQENLDQFEEIEFDDVQAQNVSQFEGKKLRVYNTGISVQELPEWRACSFYVDVCNDDGSLLIPAIQVYTNSEPLVKQLEQIKDNPNFINKRAVVKVKLVKGGSSSGWEYYTFTSWK